MKRFTHGQCHTQSGEDVINFVSHFLPTRKRILYIGTLGVHPSSLFLPSLPALHRDNVDFRFIVEKRRAPSSALADIGLSHQQYLSALIPKQSLSFCDVDIVANDGATVGGRNAASAANHWYRKNYTDIVIDATGMSRGVCFPMVQQAIEQGLRHNMNVHLLVASNDQQSIRLSAESNDRAEWMHGFQQSMGLDRTADTLKLWVPQLSENTMPQMRAMFQQLGATSSVAEVCPIVPFPSKRPRRGDDLLFEFESEFYGDWESSHLNVIYAQESNPMDVFNSIVKLDTVRKEVFTESTQRAETVLSPCGWRIGSLGMLLAAIDRDLPMLYVETISYSTMSTLPKEVEVGQPDHLWHVLLVGTPYDHTPLSSQVDSASP